MQDIMVTISSLFQNPNDQIRQAAAISLGSITIGNTGFFLEQVFQMIQQSQPQQKYMFLSTLREIINSKPECLAQFIKELMPLYLSQASSDDEPIRNIVAESIGKLYVTHPEALAKMLLDALQSTDAVVIATCAKAFKYSAHKTKQAPPHFG